MTPDEIIYHHAFQKSRRDFISTTGKATLLAGVAGSSFLQSCVADKSVKITIVGAGVAGLNAAYTLRKAGHDADIYEASSRTGGRMFTAKDIMGAGLTTELGGEFIDSSHEEMFSLANAFQLPLIDTQTASEKELNHACYYFDGRILSDADIIQMISPFAVRIQQDIDSLSEEISYRRYSEADARLDQLSIAAYLTGIGISGTLYNLLDVAYTTEYGLNIEEQSAINFLVLIAMDMKDEFNYSGYSDERYKIQGGNQRITDALSAHLSSQLHTGYTLESINSKSGGKKIMLNFIQSNGSAKEVETDFAIITIPFTILRDIPVNIECSPAKRKAIAEMGYGRNAKLLIGFSEPYWRNLGYTGFAFSDNGLQNGWDNSQLQKGEGAGFTIFTGGAMSSSLATGTEQEQAAIYLSKMDPFFKDAMQHYTQKAARFHWPTHPYSKASYTCFRPGQFTTIEGAQKENEGNLYFAGEHCSYEFQGFMNGAAQTGRIAAEQIINLLD